MVYVNGDEPFEDQSAKSITASTRLPHRRPRIPCRQRRRQVEHRVPSKGTRRPRFSTPRSPPPPLCLHFLARSSLRLLSPSHRPATTAPSPTISPRSTPHSSPSLSGFAIRIVSLLHSSLGPRARLLLVRHFGCVPRRSSALFLRTSRVEL